jgi:hypothetical protein
MQPKYLQELIKNLQEFYKCPSCETNYHFDDIRSSVRLTFIALYSYHVITARCRYWRR